MVRLLVTALALLLAPAAVHAATTLPVRGEVSLMDPMAPLAVVTGDVTFDDTALAGGLPAVPVDSLQLEVEVLPIAGVALPVGEYSVTETSPELNATPQVWSFGDGFALEIDAAFAFGGTDYAILAPADGTVAVFDPRFTPVAEGSLGVVPLPGAVWMLGAGIAALAGARHWRTGVSMKPL